ncbi:MAG: hypothetical protein Q4D98_09685, partial [Planctomycetia bacterium]|nr:hypothetical protein [Planctomycetia bacterium]
KEGNYPISPKLARKFDRTRKRESVQVLSLAVGTTGYNIRNYGLTPSVHGSARLVDHSPLTINHYWDYFHPPPLLFFPTACSILKDDKILYGIYFK